MENVNHVILKEVQNDTMKIKIKYQINKKYIMKKIETNFYRNKMIIAKKEGQIIKNYMFFTWSYVELQNKLKTLEEKFKNE